VCDTRARADAHPVHDGVIGLESHLLAEIGHVERWILALVHPERDARTRALIVERSFQLHAGASLAAPRQGE
jgi:hypothetical protein